MQVSSTGNELAIRFKTDSLIGGRGFNVSWQAVPGGEWTKEKSIATEAEPLLTFMKWVDRCMKAISWQLCDFPKGKYCFGIYCSLKHGIEFNFWRVTVYVKTRNICESMVRAGVGWLVRFTFSLRTCATCSPASNSSVSKVLNYFMPQFRPLDLGKCQSCKC